MTTGEFGARYRGYEVEPRVLSADPLYRVRATDLGSGPLGRNVENASFSALVDPDGIVRSYELRYERVRNGTRVTVVERLRYTNVVGSDGPVRDASR